MTIGRAIGTCARSIAWAKADPPGAEFAVVQLESRRLRAKGIAIGSNPEPYRLSFELQTRDEYITDTVVVESQGAGWMRRLEIKRSPAGVWSVSSQSTGRLEMPEPGGDPAGLGDALDVDLALSPVFNTMPVLRHDLHNGGKAGDFLMIWISVPDLSIHASPQRYTFVERHAGAQRLVRFEAVGEDEDFAADVQFDSDGLVVDYPCIASRIGTHGPASSP
jgi:uncharacterized protein